MKNSKQDDLWNMPGIKSLSAEKQHMIMQLKKMLQNKTPNEALPVLMEWQRQMKQKNIHFTPEENQLLSHVFYSSLTPAQQKQYELLQRMMKKNSP